MSTFVPPLPTTVAIRAADAEDLDGIERLFDGLSEDSRYRRWFTSSVDLDGAARWAIGGGETLSLVAVVGAEIVGHGILVPIDGRRAEVAFEVAGEWRHHAVATHLLRALSQAALERGLSVIEADVLAENRDMLAVLREHGPCATARDGSVIHVTTSLAAAR